MLTMLPLAAANKYDNPDTLVVSRDGTGEFRTIDEAIEVCRAFMDYTKVGFPMMLVFTAISCVYLVLRFCVFV